ncbi:MAG: hypothetical protein AAFQ36_09485 [Pseudomonadota bacterium]
MTYNRTQLITEALQEIGVIADDQAATAGEVKRVGRKADALFSELKTMDGLTGITWTLETIPDAVFDAFSLWLAQRIAPSYEIAPPRGMPLSRIRSALLPDDRTDSRDLDGDGTISEAEAQAGLEARYY